MELKKKDDGYWHVGFDTEHGYRWKNTFATSREEAEKICRDAKVAELEMAAKTSRLTGEVISCVMAGRKVTCQQVIEEWVEHRQNIRAATTTQTQAYHVAQFLNDNNLGRLIINRIDTSHIDPFINGPTCGSKSGRSGRLAAIRSYFNFAAARGYIVGSPADLVEVNHRMMTHEQKEPKARVPITEAEYRTIMAGTTGFWRWATAISYWAGLRLIDVACLEWASFQNNEIVSWTRKRGVRVALPLSDPLIGGGELGRIMIEIMEAVPKRGRSANLIFPDQAAKITDLARRSQLSTYYHRIIRRLGIDEAKTFHCLRHAFATRLDAAGKTETEIGRLIGHASTETTRGYIHRS